MSLSTPTPTGRSHAEQRHVSSQTVRRAAVPTDDADGDGTQRSEDRLTRVDGAKRMLPVPGARRAAEPGHAASTSSIFSIELAVRDHARLAERLADHISQLRQARLTHDDIAAPRDRLHAFLTDDLIPYLHNEEATMYARSAGSRWPGWLGARAQRRTRRRLRDHSEIIAAADAVRSAETTLQALNRAEQARALLDAHLVAEDRELLAAARSNSDAGRQASLSGALATELQQILAQDHLRIARAVTLARRRHGRRPRSAGCLRPRDRRAGPTRGGDGDPRLSDGAKSPAPPRTGRDPSDAGRPALRGACAATPEPDPARRRRRGLTKQGATVGPSRACVAAPCRGRRAAYPAPDAAAASRASTFPDRTPTKTGPTLPDPPASRAPARRLANQDGDPRPAPDRSLA